VEPLPLIKHLIIPAMEPAMRTDTTLRDTEALYICPFTESGVPFALPGLAGYDYIQKCSASKRRRQCGWHVHTAVAI
jgi:hypothetical protein